MKTIVQKWMWIGFVGLSISTMVVSDSAAVSKEDSGKRLLSGLLLDKAGLKLGWQVDLPLKTGETIDRLFVQDSYLYIMTTNNYLFCIDRNKGMIRFGLPLARKGLPIGLPSYYDGKAWFMVGNRMEVVDPRIGTICESVDLKSIGTSTMFGVIRNSSHLYLAGPDGRLRALVPEEYWQRFSVTADNNSRISSAVADEDYLVFATEGGNVVRIDSGSPAKQWQYDLPEGVFAPIAKDAEWIYVAAMDTKLYKLSILDGHNGWTMNFQTGVSNRSGPVLGKKVVYQPAGKKGLYAIDQQSGTMLWNLSAGQQVITEQEDTAYVFVLPSVLYAIDNPTGRIRYAMNFSPIRHHAVNLQDSVLYVADDAGRIGGIEILPNR